MANHWSTSGVDLQVEVRGERRAGLERALREAIRDGRLRPGERMPSTRALAGELGLARGTVTAAYDQLAAEGYLSARRGSGTVVAQTPRPPAEPAREPATAAAIRFDLRPGRPDLTSFPVAAWQRAIRRALGAAPAESYGYGDMAGRIELRTALAGYLGRARGVRTTPDRIVVCGGYVQALGLLARVLGPSIAMEDPCLPYHREIVRRAGATVAPLPVDDLGARTDLLSGLGVRAAVLTPAHQYPTGVTLHPARRRALLAYDGYVIEDDYDGEFRYDRQPVGVVQGMAPDRVIYVGTASKTLAPGLRLAWLAVPDDLTGPLIEAKQYIYGHTDAIGQLALAELITSHLYDRHVRAGRLRYRRRRDLLVDRLAGHRLRGVSAGLHVLLDEVPEAPIVAAAAGRGLALSGIADHCHGSAVREGIIIGYGTPPAAAYPLAVDALVAVVREVRG